MGVTREKRITIRTDDGDWVVEMDSTNWISLECGASERVYIHKSALENVADAMYELSIELDDRHGECAA